MVKKFCLPVLKTSGSYGRSCQLYTVGAPTHEAISVVAKEQGVPPIVQPPEKNKGYVQRASYPYFVEQFPVSHLGTHIRGMLSPKFGNNRCIKSGLGSDPGWSPSPGSLGRPTSLLAHKLPGDEGCISGSQLLFPRPEGLPRVGMDRQHISRLLHKSPGRTAFKLVFRLVQQLLLWAQGRLLSIPR